MRIASEIKRFKRTHKGMYGAYLFSFLCFALPVTFAWFFPVITLAIMVLALLIAINGLK